MHRHTHIISHAHAWPKAHVVPSTKNLSSSCHLSGTPCRLIRTARFPCCSLHCPHPFHLHFLALAKRRSNQEPAPIHAALEVTVLRSPILSQVMSPKWFATKWLATRRLSTSSTRSSLNKRVLTLPKIRSSTPLKKVKLRKMRIRSPCHSTSHSCLRPRIQWKALPRLKRQTWMTNKFVFCWLHHGTCRTEKQVRNDLKFITLEEKV